ncbi:MAG: hypothetical protein QM767_24850 [Anaeromyxobacter sp.]
MRAHPLRRALLPAVLAALLLARPAPAAAPETYAVGKLPLAPFGASVEFPAWGATKVELGGLLLTQGTYDDRNPWAHLSMLAPFGWLHHDGVPNLRLSLGFQELFQQEVAAMGIPSGHEERVVGRARLQQPRGEAALYELLQLDVRNFTDPGGTHRLVYRPRLRVGQGFNLDAVRIHSLFLYQEVALRYSSDDYATKAFDFFRAVVGYTWTTRTGTFVSLGAVGQVSLNPPGTRYDILYGPVLTFAHKFRAPPPQAAPPPPGDVLD